MISRVHPLAVATELQRLGHDEAAAEVRRLHESRRLVIAALRDLLQCSTHDQYARAVTLGHFVILNHDE